MNVGAGWVIALAVASAAPAVAADRSAGIVIPGTSLTRYEIKTRDGRTVRYYLSLPKQPAPLLLMIQGSGCGTVLRQNPGGGSSYSTLYNLLPYAAEGKFAVLAVEKPFSADSANDGTAKDCSPAFNADFTAESWADALQAALGDVRRRGGIDTKRTAILGMSEGAVMAALLASRDPSITHVMTVGGPGTSQVFDFVEQAYQRCFDRVACLTDVERQVAAINKRPGSAKDFA